MRLMNSPLLNTCADLLCQLLKSTNSYAFFSGEQIVIHRDYKIQDKVYTAIIVVELKEK